MPRKRNAPTVVERRGCSHHNMLDLGYVAWHEEAERRAASGWEQTQCSDCGLWLWPDEVGLAP